jgi:hypothetical protein
VFHHALETQTKEKILECHPTMAARKPITFELMFNASGCLGQGNDNLLQFFYSWDSRLANVKTGDKHHGQT